MDIYKRITGHSNIKILSKSSTNNCVATDFKK